MNKFNIVLADPPWFYNKRNNDKTRFSRGVYTHYDTMTTEDICNLRVSEITDENCALILWVTFPRLQDGLKVMESWGFRYVTIAFNWFKTNKNETPFFGIGYYTKSNTEIALLGVKGKMKPVSNYVSQVVVAEKERHSKKPDVVHRKIVELFGDLPKIELFARDNKEGWVTVGNEISGKSIENEIEELVERCR